MECGQRDREGEKNMFDMDDILGLFGFGAEGGDDNYFENDGEEFAGRMEGEVFSRTGEEGVAVDLDDDGAADGMIFQHLQDTDGDGIADTEVIEQYFDTDGDGIADTEVVEQYFDTDGDGRFDTVQADWQRDTDGDGIADVHSMLVGQDTDGDGIVDMLMTAEGFDNDGIFDSVQEYSDLDASEILNDDTVFADGCAPAYETFDPDTANMDQVIGDPLDSMESWHYQETGSSCAVASQEFVLEQLTGMDFQESDLRDLAEEQGWYSPQGGTPMDDVGNILEHMGCTVERSGGNTIEDLQRCLENGGEVIVAVDSSEIWLGQDNDFFGPGMDADHAVQVIGIDYSSPDSPMVILNDPGAVNGGGAVLPMDVFVGAWEDSGCFMVEAYA